MRVAISYTTLIKEQTTFMPAMCVGRDTRYGAKMLADCTISGIQAAGANAVDLCVVPTGAYCVYVRKIKSNGGILITGSHMPPERIGIIAIASDGSYAPLDVTDEVENNLNNAFSSHYLVRPEKIGAISYPSDVYSTFESECFTKVDIERIRKRKFKLLVDCANGAGSNFAPRLFEAAGCTVFPLNCTEAPIFGRESEPRARTVTEARKLVVECGADLAACFDVDADRVLFVDAAGNAISEDTTGAIFGDRELAAGDVCTLPLNSSGLIARVCKKKGVTLNLCRIGQPETVKAVKQTGASFSYEESGKYYFTKHYVHCDGLFSTLKMLDILAAENVTIADLAKQYTPFFQSKLGIHVSDSVKYNIVQKAKEIMAKKLTEGTVSDLDIDGFKRTYSDESWLLIRASGTEPLVRVYSDSPSKERAEHLVDEGMKLLGQIIGDGKGLDG